MKVKEIDRTVNTAWSPGDHHPILLAAGTAAQQLDASFNTSASLEIFALNLTDPSLDLEPKYSVPSQHRYHKIAWGGDIIVGGCDNGVLQMFSVPNLLNKEDGLITSSDRHTGAVKALDFNPFQKNLLAAGATNSEIFIWDMNNTSTPMSPGVKSQPLEDVAWLAWNRQVQHILASTFPTRNVVWDLRKNEPIIKLTDTTTRVRWKVVAWHPEVATQLCLASEEDSNPVVQLWDLRFAKSQLRTFKGHTRGVLSLAWCNQDPDLLISSGKDNKILCWNPNCKEEEDEIVCEIPNSQQWVFEVNWCPRNPSLIVSSSCDGHTSIYSITGCPATQVQTNTKIADSFPGMGEAIPEPHIQSQQPVVDLKKAPKWLRKPVGATFGFGGKLVTFSNNGVNLLQVNGDELFLEQARALGERLQMGNYSEICQGKEDPIWKYLEASFNSQPRAAIRALLGYNKESFIGPSSSSQAIQNLVTQMSSDQFNLNNDNSESSINDTLNHSNSELLNGCEAVFDKISAQNSPAKVSPFSIELGNDVDSKVCKALLAGCIEEAVNICLKEGKIADALILSITAGPDILAETQRKYFQKREGYLSHILNALVFEDWSQVAKQCDLNSWKEALSAMLTYCTGSLPDLCYDLGKRLEDAGGDYSPCAEICYIASGNIAPLINKRLSGASVSIENIQELVELILVAQGAYSSKGQIFPIVGEVARVLTLYAELLSAEGELDTALQYLNDSSDEVVEDLRERLYYALGHKSIPTPSYSQHQQQQQYQTQQQQPGQTHRKASATYQNVINSQPPIMNSFNKPLSNPPSAQMAPVQHLPPAPGPPAHLSFQSGQPATPSVVQGQSYAARKTPSQPPPPQSPFVRSSSPQVQGTITSKKYVVDPSVTGNAPGGFRSSSTQPYPQQYQPSPGFQPFQPSGSSTFQPSGDSSFQPRGGFTPSAGAFQSPAPANFHPSSGTPYQTQAVPFQPPGPSVFQQSSTVFQPSSGVPTQNTFGPPTVQPIKQDRSQMLSAQNSAPSGWNDPPSLTPKQMKTEPIPQNPITHPIFGSAPQEFHPPQFHPQGPPSQFQPPPAQGQGPPPSSFQSPPGQAPPAFQPPPGQSPQQAFLPPRQTPVPFQPPGQSPAVHFQPPGQNSAPFQPPGQTPGPFQPPGQTPGPFQPPVQTPLPPQGTPQPFQPPSSTRPSQINQAPVGSYGDPPLARIAEPSKPKAPIPEKYMHIQTTFEELRGKCITASQNNQLMRRKLDDVARKLEALYDSLREEKLSESTVGGLEDLAKSVQTMDYSSGMNIITRLVSGSDFSHVASFMTGLKILLQTAQQLRVN